jgi:hypothetical protein
VRTLLNTLERLKSKDILFIFASSFNDQCKDLEDIFKCRDCSLIIGALVPILGKDGNESIPSGALPLNTASRGKILAAIVAFGPSFSANHQGMVSSHVHAFPPQVHWTSVPRFKISSPTEASPVLMREKTGVVIRSSSSWCERGRHVLIFPPSFLQKQSTVESSLERNYQSPATLLRTKTHVLYPAKPTMQEHCDSTLRPHGGLCYFRHCSM